MSTISTLAPRRPKFAADWPAERPVERPMLRKGTSRGFSRIPIAFCIGIAVTLAWQSYGDAAREIIAEWYPPLAWLAPRGPGVLPAPATMPPITSLDPQEISRISFGLAAVRQRVDQLAVGQDQINRDITTKLQAAKQEILDKISLPSPQPASGPAPKPVPTASQPSPVR
jgi:hypothetical protein